VVVNGTNEVILVDPVSETSMIPVSIIVPARNEEKYIARSLNSLLSQDYEGICEILVFDGKSEDGTRKIVEEIAKNNPVVRLLENLKIRQAGAMNAGIGVAKGVIIVRADAHALYEPDYVSQCVHRLQTTDAANVGGPMRPVIGKGVIEKAIGFCYLSKFGMGVARFHDSRAEGYADTVWLGAFWKTVLDELGPFNEEVPRIDDLLFNYRLRAAGHKIFLTPKIKSFYFPASTLGAFLRKAFTNGFAIGRAFLLLPGAFAPRHLVPFSYVTTLIALSILSLQVPWARLLLVGVLALYFSLAILFSLPALRSSGLRVFGLMPFVFFALHFQYGLGTLYGMGRGLLWGRVGSLQPQVPSGNRGPLD